MNEEPFVHVTSGAGDYSVEHVASIAAQFLSGDHYKDAANRALALMDACRGELNERARLAAVYTRAVAERQKWVEEFVPTLKGDADSMSWRAALTNITGGKVEGRAQPLFKRFLAYQWRLGIATWTRISIEVVPNPPARWIDNRISEFKRDGINRFEVGQYTAAYKDWKKKDDSERAKKNGSRRGRAKVKKT